MSEETDNTMDRRAFVRRAGTVGAAGAMVWAAPSITTLSRAFGATPGTPDCGRIQSTTFDLTPDTIFGANLDNQMEQRSAPTNPVSRTGPNAILANNKVFVWAEGIFTVPAVALPNPSTVQGISPNTLPPGTYAVFMIHAQAANEPNTQRGGVSFTGDIAGVTSTNAGLINTDQYSKVSYNTNINDGRRFEDVGDPAGNTDFGRVYERRVEVRTRQGNFPDQMRVFVVCEPPVV